MADGRLWVKADGVVGGIPIAVSLSPPGGPQSPFASTLVAGASAGAGQIDEITCSNLSAWAFYLGVLDKAIAPIAGDTILFPILVPAGESVTIPFPFGFAVSTGKAFAWSTDPALVALPQSFAFGQGNSWIGSIAMVFS